MKEDEVSVKEFLLATLGCLAIIAAGKVIEFVNEEMPEKKE